MQVEYGASGRVGKTMNYGDKVLKNGIAIVRGVRRGDEITERNLEELLKLGTISVQEKACPSSVCSSQSCLVRSFDSPTHLLQYHKRQSGNSETYPGAAAIIVAHLEGFNIGRRKMFLLLNSLTVLKDP